jgi:hypothetical protein
MAVVGKFGHEIEALAASVEPHIAAEVVAAPRLSAQCQKHLEQVR